MAKKTYAQIQQQIEALKRQAEVLKAREVEGVVARIREAIEHYGLTESDLFGAHHGGRGPRAIKRTRTAKAGKKTRAPGVIRFRDEAGNAWTGRGTRPRWFKEALASGKTLEDLTVTK